MSDSTIELLTFKSFRPAKADVTVPIDIRFDAGERLVVVHFRVTEADLLLVERKKRSGWAIKEQATCPITESSVKEHLEMFSQSHSTQFALVVVGGGFEVDLPTSLRAEPIAQKILEEPSSVIPQASDSRIHMVTMIGSQPVVVSHTKQSVSTILRMVEGAGMTVIGVQSSIFGLICRYVDQGRKDARTILCNGAGYVIIDQDETGRIADLGQFSADNEVRIPERFIQAFDEMGNRPRATYMHHGGAVALREALQGEWEPLADGDDLQFLVDDFEPYYHIHWAFEHTRRPVPKSLMPVVVVVWIVFAMLLGRIGLDAANSVLAMRQQQQLRAEIAAASNSLEFIREENTKMNARREQSKRIAVWLRGQENYQQLLTKLVEGVPDDVVLRNVAVRENRSSSSGSAIMFSFVAVVAQGTQMQLADEYFSAIRERIAEDGWLIAESEPSPTQIKIQAARR